MIACAGKPCRASAMAGANQFAKGHAAQSVRSAAMTSGDAGMSWFQMLNQDVFETGFLEYFDGGGHRRLTRADVGFEPRPWAAL